MGSQMGGGGKNGAEEKRKEGKLERKKTVQSVRMGKKTRGGGKT